MANAIRAVRPVRLAEGSSCITWSATLRWDGGERAIVHKDARRLDRTGCSKNGLQTMSYAHTAEGRVERGASDQKSEISFRSKASCARIRLGTSRAVHGSRLASKKVHYSGIFELWNHREQPMSLPCTFLAGRNSMLERRSPIIPTAGCNQLRRSPPSWHGAQHRPERP